MCFKNIVFGMAAAKKEKSNSPHLLIEGFLDAYGYIEEILEGNKLGPVTILGHKKPIKNIQ